MKKETPKPGLPHRLYGLFNPKNAFNPKTAFIGLTEICVQPQENKRG